MLTYRYNLLGLGYSTGQYKNVATRALSVSRRASAVDTGLFRRGWSTQVVGDFLLVSNGVRYAGPVELGSVVHKKHQYKVRDALAGLGLGQGTVVLSTGTSAVFDTGTTGGSTRPRRDPKTDIPTDQTTPPTSPSTPPIPPTQVDGGVVPSDIAPISIEDILDTPNRVRDARRTAQEMLTPRLTRANPKLSIPKKSQLFNKLYLLGLLAVQREKKQEEEVNE